MAVLVICGPFGGSANAMASARLVAGWMMRQMGFQQAGDEVAPPYMLNTGAIAVLPPTDEYECNGLWMPDGTFKVIDTEPKRRMGF